jgi:hypothetical protein
MTDYYLQEESTYTSGTMVRCGRDEYMLPRLLRSALASSALFSTTTGLPNV